ncbi:MAG: hypothetical protein WBD47_06790 [Phormidesmis sp.]
MKPASFLTHDPANSDLSARPLSTHQLQPHSPLITQPAPLNIRHILLGNPDAIRQTIHLLHTLHYSEPILWSPVLTITDPITLTPAQGEAISLLRKQL